MQIFLYNHVLTGIGCLLYKVINVLYQLVPRRSICCHNDCGVALDYRFSASIPGFIAKINQVISNTGNKLNIMLNDDNCFPIVRKTVNDFNESVNILRI